MGTPQADVMRPEAADWVPAVVELRQYTLHPGARDTLITLFDREFVGPQEQAGMRVIGQFRDVDDPDRFVWFRGFRSMEARASGLAAFYGGRVWLAHREAANATMIDSDDVLLLRPLDGFNFTPTPRLGRDEQTSGGVVAVSVYFLSGPPSGDLIALFVGALEDAAASAGGPAVALLQTESAANTFPALPVREGEQVLVRVCRFPTWTAHDQHVQALASSAAWAAANESLAPYLAGPTQNLRLAPTHQSALR